MMMDVVKELCVAKDFGNFDMNVLASTLTSTDVLIAKIKEQTLENANLKTKLQSLNESAMQIKDVYTMEKEKSSKIESENLVLKERLEDLETKLQFLENQLTNETSIHNQVVADLQNRTTNEESQYLDLCKVFIKQGNILFDHNLSKKSLTRQYNNIKEMLIKRGEPVDDHRMEKKKNRKTTSTGTMTDHSLEKKKQFSDKSTMYTQSTITRGITANLSPIKVSVGTIFPEPLSVEQIFQETIVDIPELIPEIEDFKWPTETVSTQTELINATNVKSIGTITAIKNVRQKINYTRKIRSEIMQQQSSNRLFDVKKEEERSPMGSTQNLAGSNQIDQQQQQPQQRGINPQLTELWKILGQTIFTIVGSGRIFDNTTNMDLINDSLNQIRTAIADPTIYPGLSEKLSKASPGIGDFNANFDTLPSINEESLNERDESMDEPPYEDFDICGNEMMDEITSPPNFDVTDIQPSTSASCYNTISVESSPIKISCPEQINSLTELLSKESEHHQSCQDIEMDSIELSNCPVTSINPLESCENEQTTDISEKYLTYANEIRTEINDEIDFNFKVPTQTVPRSRKHSPKLMIAKDKLKLKRLKARARKSTKIGAYFRQQIREEMTFVKVPNEIEATVVLNDRKEIYELLEDDVDDLSDNDIRLILSYFQISEILEPICDIALEHPQKTVEPVVENCDKTLECVEIEAKSNSSNLDYSPQSPPPCDINPTAEWIPKEILFQSTGQCSPIVDRLIKQSSASQKRTLQFDSNDMKLIGKIRRLCEIYLISEWTSINLKICSTKLLKITNEPKLLAQSILELIEDTDEPVNISFTPPAPALPASHQRLIVLVQKIAESIPKFIEICLKILEKTIFTLKSTDMSREALVNYTHFFIGLSDADDSPKVTIRLFVYKALYYMNYKAVPMIYTILMAHPAVLPKLEQNAVDFDPEHILNKTDSLTLSLQATLSDGRLYADRGKTSADSIKNASEYKKKDLRFLLSSYYNYSNELFSYEKIVHCLIARLRANHLKNLAYALILIGKKCGADWATKNIIDIHLMPMLREFLENIESCPDHDQQLATILFTISSIIKTKDVSTDVSQLHQVCLQIINATKRQAVQEAAVAALLRTNRFGVVNIYQKLCKWSPTFRLSRHLYGMLTTFVERKTRQFWRGHVMDEL